MIDGIKVLLFHHYSWSQFRNYWLNRANPFSKISGFTQEILMMIHGIILPSWCSLKGSHYVAFVATVLEEFANMNQWDDLDINETRRRVHDRVRGCVWLKPGVRLPGPGWDLGREVTTARVLSKRRKGDNILFLSSFSSPEVIWQNLS